MKVRLSDKAVVVIDTLVARGYSVSEAIDVLVNTNKSIDVVLAELSKRVEREVS